MFDTKEQMQAIIPHRGKMLLLSRIISYDTNERVIQSEYDITPDCLFYDPALGGVPSWAGFEFIAQSISALIGIKVREKGLEPPVGFILNVPSMEMKLPVFKNGSVLSIIAKEYACVDMVYTYNGCITIEGEKAVTGNIMVMEIDERNEKIKNTIDSLIKGN